jgi:hypothetical protein
MSLAFHSPSSASRKLPAPAVYLHTSWRTAGTWIWHQFRANPATMAFYEPLHEELAALSLDGIADTNTDSWESGHPATAPYFLEYAPLLQRSRRGVTGFDRKFAYDRFFMRPDEPNDRLRDYLERLHNLAYASGRRPVFKFCRSLGRAAWMRRAFADATHIGVVRDPIVQFESCYRLARLGRPYFLAMPAALIAANRDPVVMAICEALDTRLHHMRSHDFRVGYKRAEAFVITATPQEAYRVLLAFWLATAISGLPSMDVVVDSDRLSDSSDYRDSLRSDLHERTGIELDFSDPREPRRESGLLSPATVEAIHERGTALVQKLGATPIVAEKLATSTDRYLVTP